MPTYDDNYLNMVKTSLKVLKDNCCTLTSLSFEAFVCLEVWPLGHDRSVLLSVVDQALLCNSSVCRFPLLSSDDADGGCQYEVQASECWILY
jgi:hypothetical protein